MDHSKTLQLRVSGIVQGVGFRPYVYGLAHQCSVSGYVLNDGGGVTVVIEGEEEAVERFMARLRDELPLLARIDDIQEGALPYHGFEGFEIRQSDGDGSKSATVSPDMAVCENCLQEMRDPSDRRYGYWLINCTDCGPRYSITATVPYDRPNTSMRDFEMCPECRTEYEDPANRRYHAQPISCHRCGPKMFYLEAGTREEGESALNAAVAALKAGKAVAIKGLGGFHLVCDATSDAAVAILRERKRRPSKPFAVMFPDIEAIRAAAEVSSAEAATIASREKPIVLLRSRPSSIAPSVAPGIDRLGAFLPYTPLHYRLFESIKTPLVATSANLSDEPIIRSVDELQRKLEGVADGVLTHEREIVNACDDSVMQLLDDRPLMLRLARGVAPYTMRLPKRTSRKILAVGANQKNSIALAFDDKIIVSPHIGDLGSLEAFEYFERTMETFKGFYGFEPDVVVCDKHPGYETTKWARSLGARNENVEVVEVQHHYAHLLAGIAEFGLSEEVLGFAFDGTGYGDDGSIWGGEVMLANHQGYMRVCSLRPFRLLGGEKAVREPRRIALGLLFELYTLDEVLQLELPTVKAFSEAEVRALHAAWQKGLNAPVTSSMGRLFDALASLLGICQQVSYEGESGLLLEAVAGTKDAEPFSMPVDNGMIDWSPMIKALVARKRLPEVGASRFIATLAEMMVGVAKGYENEVLLSGGVFQNRKLLESVTERFDAEKIRYLLPSRFPVNDGCIALGQAWYALNKEVTGQ